MPQPANKKPRRATLRPVGLAVAILAGSGLWVVMRDTDKAPRPRARPLPQAPARYLRAPRAGFEDSSTARPFPSVHASETDEELLALARRVVALGPERGVAWVRAQTDAALGRRLLFAVLRAWGESDPAQAVAWALHHDPEDRRVEIDAVFAGAANRPQLASEIVRQILDEDPSDASGCSSSLIAGLVNAGQCGPALQFLVNSPKPPEPDAVAAIFSRWGEHQPQAAVAALTSIADDNSREAAFKALADGWSRNDPGGLAAYASSLPPGQYRGYALFRALDNWSMQDPAAMSSWLGTLPPGPDYDEGTTLMLSRTDSANLSPRDAMAWVERIGDPTLRRDSFAEVLSDWLESDFNAASTYAVSARWLDHTLRQEALKAIEAASPSAPP